MSEKKSDKNYSEFSFEDFLQDDFFISSMKKPTSETSKYWDIFRKRNENLKNFEAAKLYIESMHQYHYTLSLEEINQTRQAIRQKINRKIRSRKLFYWSAGVAAAASVVLLILLRFHSPESIHIGPDIAAFADMSRTDAKTGEIQLVLSDEQTILLDRKETVITYDTAGIVVDKEFIVQSENKGYNQLIVPVGKRSILNLSDGTKVWVNSGSRLIYPVSFANNEREIYVDGEIYIEVVKESHRPFVVRTKDMNVQVLGTKFNVTAYETDHEKKVVLVSGLVQIVSKKDKTTTRLLPNEMYLSENGQSHIEKVDTGKHISWIDGTYYCENENLKSILQRLSRYYGVEIICDPVLAGVIFSGKLDLKENLSDIFDGISFILSVSYSGNDGKYIISRAK